ncbi:hypothetical protein [Clostridium sp.]|uniref:hypothetical protein n=1 Tax=Clostridium sp. TaxID=1506 RepID=UPI00262D07EC|nr:hypothetical protein [uncultured Clostridium sp.]
MKILMGKLNIEKNILNKMIENNDGILSNNFILEQSRIVDKLILAYRNKKTNCKFKFFSRYLGTNKIIEWKI